MDAVMHGMTVENVSLDERIAQQLSMPDTRDWYWLSCEEPLSHVPVKYPHAVITDSSCDAEIEVFLHRNAPDAAVFPGNPEIDFWITIRSPEGTLAAVACGTTWSTGAHVLHSVAVSKDHRRKGLGAAVTIAAIQQHQKSGVVVVGLGVRGSNSQALSLYRTLGIRRETHFFSTSLISPEPETSEPADS
jgi:GNAT superfamily N-acetyltransferase